MWNSNWLVRWSTNAVGFRQFERLLTRARVIKKEYVSQGSFNCCTCFWGLWTIPSYVILPSCFLDFSAHKSNLRIFHIFVEMSYWLLRFLSFARIPAAISSRAVRTHLEGKKWNRLCLVYIQALNRCCLSHIFRVPLFHAPSSYTPITAQGSHIFTCLLIRPSIREVPLIWLAV